MSIFRWVFGASAALVVTVGLFFFMASLISQPHFPSEQKPYQNIQVTPQIEESKPRQEVKRPKALPQAPEPVIHENANRDLPDQNWGPKPTWTGPEPVKTDRQGVPAPIIKTAPPYPERCRARNAEGAVLVQFNVTPEGNVTNIRVIESADRCLNATVIKTISRWKYPPSYNNGRAVTQYDMVARFDFRLDE